MWQRNCNPCFVLLLSYIYVTIANIQSEVKQYDQGAYINHMIHVFTLPGNRNRMPFSSMRSSFSTNMEDEEFFPARLVSICFWYGVLPASKLFATYAILLLRSSLCRKVPWFHDLHFYDIRVGLSHSLSKPTWLQVDNLWRFSRSLT